MRLDVTPTCRYAHGPLGRVDVKGKVPEWIVTEPGHPLSARLTFGFELWVCETCGYSEFFDPDPETTFDESVSR